MNKPSFPWRSYVVLLGAALLLAVPVALLSPGDFWRGWGAAALLFALSGLGLRAAWRWAGGGRQLALWISLAFLIRVVAGIGLSLAYQAWGYDEPVYQRGYLFLDAMARDRESYRVGISHLDLLFDPQAQLSSDQYGGLGLLTAFLYRFLSPDAHRIYLSLIVGAFFFALGVPFLAQAVRLRWNEGVAQLTAWFYILYPDGIFYTSAQMREPFMLGLSAVAFWAVLAWGCQRRAALLAGLMATAGMMMISTRSALFVLGVLALLFLLEYVAARPERGWKIAGWTCLGIGAVLAVILTWAWFREAAVWDMLQTTKASGWADKLISDLGERFRVPFLLVYGLLQPVLPATLTEPTLPLFRIVGSLRALGWYLLAPLLVFAAISIPGVQDKGARRRLVWLVGVVALWSCVAALRAGADMTDNPRYRILFLIWMALAAAWAIDTARARRNAWLWRCLLIEGIFLAFFTNWYASRYYRVMDRLPFFSMVALILGLSALVVLAGLVLDWRKRRLN